MPAETIELMTLADSSKPMSATQSGFAALSSLTCASKFEAAGS
jgi:hypothetical protein